MARGQREAAALLRKQHEYLKDAVQSSQIFKQFADTGYTEFQALR